jgi:hypothetical protein
LDPLVNAADDSLEQVLEQDQLASLISYLDSIRAQLRRSEE